MDRKHCAVIVLAGGKGTRMGADTPKQYMEIIGKPILAHTLSRFQESDIVDEIILVVPSTDIGYCEAEIKNRYSLSKISNIVCGGSDRQESAYNGLKAVTNTDSVIMVHDGVRPFTDCELIKNVYEAACTLGAVIPAVKITDTIKVSPDGHRVSKTIDRENLMAVQTPQAFHYEILQNAYIKAARDGYKGTDDASLAEYAGYDVYLVKGDKKNIKITTADDFLYAGYIFGEKMLLERLRKF
jgi:2-C-methyl-D-erythritol 4-phosphate cytidylyltransferase